MAFFNNYEKELSWLYEGRTKTGDLVRGTVEAPTAIIARVKLRKREITPISIKAQSSFSLFTNIFANLRSKSSNTHEKRVSLFTGLARSREIHNLVQGKDKESKNKKKAKSPVKDKEITIFIKQFVVVIKAGVPLLRAFDIVINGQENRKFVLILQDIKFGVENGLSLS